MRDIELEHEGDWLILKFTRTRRESVRIKRIYLARDEAGMVVSLLRNELEREPAGKTTSGEGVAPGTPAG